jgi:hypothetical protein
MLPHSTTQGDHEVVARGELDDAAQPPRRSCLAEIVPPPAEHGAVPPEGGDEAIATGDLP